MIKPKLSTLCFQSVENVDVLCKFLKNHNHKKLSDDKHLTMVDGLLFSSSSSHSSVASSMYLLTFFDGSPDYTIRFCVVNVQRFIVSQLIP